MSYILEHQNEFERLEKQNRDPEFDPLQDLKKFNFGQPETILDAGCGSGAMTFMMERFYPNSKIVGVDASEQRVRQLHQKRGENSALEFIQADLQDLPFANATFDVILVRYVLQHLSAKALGESLKELYRCLKPGGKLCIVDVDGYFETLYPTGPRVQQLLDLAKKNEIIDLNVGRKLPYSLENVGFRNIHWDLQVVPFVYQSRQREVSRLSERLSCMKNTLIDAGMSPAEFEELQKEAHQLLEMPNSVCYFNRFYITATKPTVYLASA